MAKYIDQEETLKIIYDFKENCEHINYGTLLDINRAIRKLQTEEVTPIIRGKWIKRYVITDTKTIELNVCSECNEEFSYDAETGMSMDNYSICPNCGAKMKESEEKNE